MDDTTAIPDQPNGDSGSGGSGIVQTPSGSSPVPTPGFSNLSAPEPIDAAPPGAARAIAFAAILVGGLLGGLVGYGIGDVLYPASAWSAVAALAGALTGAIGLGVLANLTLRAMNEWKTAAHPESTEKPTSVRSPRSSSSGS